MLPNRRVGCCAMQTHTATFAPPGPCTLQFRPSQLLQRPYHSFVAARRPRCSSTRRARRAHAAHTHASAAAAAASPSPQAEEPRSSARWEKICGCDVVTWGAAEPVAIVRFYGGLGAGVAPRELYGTFLSEVARRGNVAVVAAPVLPSFDHLELARVAATQTSEALDVLRARWDVSWMPVFGMGHSLGSKLQLLAGCDEEARAAQGPCVANILLSFNNFTADESIPQLNRIRNMLSKNLGDMGLLEVSQVGDFLKNMNLEDLFSSTPYESSAKTATDLIKSVGSTLSAFSKGEEFSPSPSELLALIADSYNVPSNLLISFTNDTLDQSGTLETVLNERFASRDTRTRILPGTHVTPLSPDLGDDIRETGSEFVDRGVRRAANSVSEELDGTVTVVVAFIRLHLEVLREQNLLPVG